MTREATRDLSGPFCEPGGGEQFIIQKAEHSRQDPTLHRQAGKWGRRNNE